MPRIDLTECARRAEYTPNKSGRDSIYRWFLSTPEDRAALQYRITNNRGTVEEVAFMAALKRVRQEREDGGGPGRNLCRRCISSKCDAWVNVASCKCPKCGVSQPRRGRRPRGGG